MQLVCSLHIHVPQCQAKFEKTQAAKPPSERRELPAQPAELSLPLPTAADEIDAFNARMSATFNGVSLVQCENCGRSFNETAFAKHKHLCTAAKPMKPLRAAPAAAASAVAAADERKQAARAAPAAPLRTPSIVRATASSSAAAAEPIKAVYSDPGKAVRSDPIKAVYNDPAAGTARLPPVARASAAPGDAEEAGDSEELQKCGGCGRSFAAAAFERHTRICKKVF